MEKNVIFGNVLALLLVNTLFSPAIVRASEMTLVQAYEKVEQQTDNCFSQAEDGHNDFPVSYWLDSLDESNKEDVLKYLSMISFNACVSGAIGEFKEVLSKENKGVKDFISRFVSLEPYNPNKPDNIDIKELENLESKVTEPFRVSDILEK